MTQRKIAIVTVNYKTPELVVNSLKRLVNEPINKLGIYVVDNDSQDNSVEIIMSYINQNNLNEKIRLYNSNLNGGFAFGSNIGIRNALNDGFDYIMLLNPDTEIESKAVKSLADYLDNHPFVGVVGSQLKNLNGKVEPSAHRFHSVIGEFVDAASFGILTKILSKYEVTPPILDVPHQCDWVSGSSMMIRKKVFDDIGLIDEEYFLYFEEVDFFFRAKRAGWQTWYVPQSKVMHIEGASTGITQNKRRPSYWYESRRRFFIKHYGVLGLISADILWFFGRISFLIRKCLKLGAQNPIIGPKWLMYDLIIGDILAILSGKVWRMKKEKVN